MATPKQISLKVLPDEVPKVPPYANTSFTYANGPVDITVVFLRAPLLTDDDVGQLSEDPAGEKIARGHVVASITMPRAMAVDLGKRLAALGSNPAGAEP